MDKDLGEAITAMQRLYERLSAARTALLRIRSHWREFGPEHGFDETLELSCDEAMPDLKVADAIRAQRGNPVQ